MRHTLEKKKDKFSVAPPLCSTWNGKFYQGLIFYSRNTVHLYRTAWGKSKINK